MIDQARLQSFTKRRRGLACLAAALFALAGCDDRRAGTEVGNPEITMTVSARFAAYDNQGDVEVQGLDFNVLRMKYATVGDSIPPDSGTCWNRPGGTLVDFAGSDTVPLPDTSVRSEDWSSVEMVLRTPDGSRLLPDLADFRSWNDPGHAKFYLVRNNDTLRALFEMPKAMEFHLLYSQSIIGYWHWDNEMKVSIYFDAGKWTHSLDPRAPWTTRTDGMHRPYVLFSPTENAAAWSDLKTRLPGSFSADSVQVR